MPPPVAEMERVIDADHQKYVGHCVDRPRHTQQVDYFHYEHDIRTRNSRRDQAGRTAPPSCPGNGMTRADVASIPAGATCSGWHFPVPATASGAGPSW